LAGVLQSLLPGADAAVVLPCLPHLLVPKELCDLGKPALLERPASNLTLKFSERLIAVADDERFWDCEVDHHVVHPQEAGVNACRVLDLEEADQMTRTAAKPDHVNVLHDGASSIGSDDRKLRQAARPKLLAVSLRPSVRDPYVVALEVPDVAKLRLNLGRGPRFGKLLLRSLIVAWDQLKWNRLSF
jgi:hypothetical protein